MALKEKLYRKIYGKSLYERRMRWTQKRIERLPAGARVLDAGAGQCKNKQFCSKLDYVSQDFCQVRGVAVSEQERKLATPSDSNAAWDTSHIDIVSDIIDIPVEDGSFDAVICTEVFEHILRPDLAVKEFSRILRGGGTLITTAPACSGCHMAPYFYYNGLSEYWYREVFQKYGFRMVELRKNGNTFDKLKEMNNNAAHYAKFYAKDANIKFSTAEKLIMHLSGCICNKYAKKTRGSQNYYTNEILCVAKKE